jgi:hypothetical protein
MRLWCAFVLIAGAAGCADTHLGDFHGRRARGALDAQAQAQPLARGGDSAGTLDADDAKLTLARQRGRGIQGVGSTGQPAGYGAGLGVGGSTAAGIPSSTPSGPIRLDAVR